MHQTLICLDRMLKREAGVCGLRMYFLLWSKANTPGTCNLQDLCGTGSMLLLHLISTDTARAGSELQSLKCEEAELRLKIQNLEKPLDNVDAVTLTEEELAVIQAVQSDDGDVNSSGPCEMDARDIPSRCRGICESAVDVSMDCADDRLQPQPDAAQQDPLRSQRQSDHADVHASGVARVFGRVPAFSPLPDDPTAAMILSCNRYTSSVSHLDTFQTMGRACNSVQGAQHYMSGRHHVVFMQPTCGAFWGLPVVQKGIEEHAEQADELAAALQKMLIEREVREDNTAASLAVQLAYTQPTPVPHNEALPRRVNVRAHMHNFTCYIPSQLDEHSRWRSSFVDSNRLVTDPKQELHVRSLLFENCYSLASRALRNILGWPCAGVCQCPSISS